MIVGIDEVGRGCWAGPLVAGAVILREPILGLRDSKKLSKIQREKLASQIKIEAVSIGLGWVWPEDIDRYGLTEAVKRAMSQAVEQIESDYSEIIIDGNVNYLADFPLCKDGSCKGITTMVGADDKVPSVSAASIVAKVARDDYMAEQALLHPGYGFEKHVGYGTAQHISALRSQGVCELHRLSFKPVKAMLGSAV